MATTIVTKNSSTASAVPTAAQLVQGELAVNVADKKLYTEDNAGSIIVLADGVKLDGIEALADVTDTANVTAAGALMDSELTNITAVKALNQGVATTDSPSFVGLTASGEIAANGGIALGDNDKATFGDSDDLQIYHDGSNSYIEDAGAGVLFIKGTGGVYLRGKDSDEDLGRFLENGAVDLYYDGSSKLATTSTGIDVTGQINASTNLVAGTSVYSNNGVYYGSSTLSLKNSSAGSFVDFASNGNATFFGTATMDGLTSQLTADAQGKFSGWSPTGSTSTAHGAIELGSIASYQGIIAYDGSSNTRFLFDNSWSGTGSTFEFRTNTAATAKTHLKVEGTGDISFYEDTGTSPKFVWSASAESLGIGTSSPDTQLTLYKASTNADVNYAKMRMDSWGASTGKLKSIVWDDAGSSVAGIGAEYDGAKTNIHFHSQYNGGFKGTADRTMSIMGDGNVGIGTAAPESIVHIKDTGNVTTTLQIEGAATGYAPTINFDGIVGASADYLLGEINGSWDTHTNVVSAIRFESGADTTNKDDGLISFWTSSSGPTLAERMRIDASGNVLVGHTSAEGDSSGTTLYQNGQTVHKADGAYALELVRSTSDGEIVRFRKDGAPVGSIGVNAGSIAFGQSNTGLGAFNTDRLLFPATSSGVVQDNAIDLGYSNGRFQDIYATNGTIQTSDRNEKQDIEVLSEAEQRVAVAAKGLLRKFRWKDSVEEKGDDARIHFGIIAQDLQAAFEAEGLDAGRYAMFISTTWTDEETNEEKTRMGVRYSELLAFIIAAL